MNTFNAQPAPNHLSLDHTLQVDVSNPIFGRFTCIARDVSNSHIFLETFDPLPLGTELHIHFEMPDSYGEVVAVGEVKRHYFLNYGQEDELMSLMGMWLRLTSFEDDGEVAHGRRTLH